MDNFYDFICINKKKVVPLHAIMDYNVRTKTILIKTIIGK